MKLKVNGQQLVIGPFSKPPNLTEVIESLGHNPLTVVVEFNGIIASPNSWESQKVKDGDTLEIVTIVGGGY